MNQYAARRGFSLVELSIVLVILGLLVGGILAGQSLVRAAELRAVGTEYQRYVTATNAFRDKYFALPGDMANATAFWGAQNTTPATCQTTASTSALTCDGNGNGLVQDGTYEMFRFWQHLANAGLIEGNYTGVAGSANVLQHIPGTNAPASKMPRGGWSYSYLGNFSGDAATYALDYGHVLWFGRANGGRMQTDVLKPEEAWNIDTKVDDGKPATGKIVIRTETYNLGNASACSTSVNNADYTGVYNLSVSAIVCALMIRQQ